MESSDTRGRPLVISRQNSPNVSSPRPLTSPRSPHSDSPTSPLKDRGTVKTQNATDPRRRASVLRPEPTVLPTSFAAATSENTSSTGEPDARLLQNDFVALLNTHIGNALEASKLSSAHEEYKEAAGRATRRDERNRQEYRDIPRMVEQGAEEKKRATSRCGRAADAASIASQRQEESAQALSSKILLLIEESAQQQTAKLNAIPEMAQTIAAQAEVIANLQRTIDSMNRACRELEKHVSRFDREFVLQANENVITDKRASDITRKQSLHQANCTQNFTKIEEDIKKVQLRHAELLSADTVTPDAFKVLSDSVDALIADSKARQGSDTTFSEQYRGLRKDVISLRVQLKSQTGQLDTIPALCSDLTKQVGLLQSEKIAQAARIDQLHLQLESQRNQISELKLAEEASRKRTQQRADHQPEIKIEDQVNDSSTLSRYPRAEKRGFTSVNAVQVTTADPRASDLAIEGLGIDVQRLKDQVKALEEDISQRNEAEGKRDDLLCRHVESLRKEVASVERRLSSILEPGLTSANDKIAQLEKFVTDLNKACQGVLLSSQSLTTRFDNLSTDELRDSIIKRLNKIFPYASMAQAEFVLVREDRTRLQQLLVQHQAVVKQVESLRSALRKQISDHQDPGKIESLTKTVDSMGKAIFAANENLKNAHKRIHEHDGKLSEVENTLAGTETLPVLSDKMLGLMTIVQECESSQKAVVRKITDLEDVKSRFRQKADESLAEMDDIKTELLDQMTEERQSLNTFQERIDESIETVTRGLEETSHALAALKDDHEPKLKQLRERVTNIERRQTQDTHLDGWIAPPDIKVPVPEKSVPPSQQLPRQPSSSSDILRGSGRKKRGQSSERSTTSDTTPIIISDNEAPEVEDKPERERKRARARPKKRRREE